MTHVLFVTPWYPSSRDPTGGTFVREQARALAAAGHKVGVIVGAPQDPDERTDSHGILALHGWAQGSIPIGSSLRAMRAARALYARYAAERGRPDLLHAHVALPAGLGAMTVARRAGIPFVLTEHSSVYARGLLRPWHGPMLARVLRSASARVAVSPSLAALLEERYGKAGSWSVIGNVVDETFFRPGEVLSPEDPFRFVCIGTLGANKGQADLLRAFARAFPAESNVALRLGGSGPDREALERLTQELGLARRVTFLGALSRDLVRDEIQHAGAVVLASRYETFGVVLIEALACGVPVVATRCGGPESIVNAANGILSPPRDPQSLAAALTGMYGEASRFDRARIRADCVARFGRAAFVGAVEALYAGVLRATRR